MTELGLDVLAEATGSFSRDRFDSVAGSSVAALAGVGAVAGVVRETLFPRDLTHRERVRPARASEPGSVAGWRAME